jgi:hypothetical protein
MRSLLVLGSVAALWIVACSSDGGVAVDAGSDTASGFDSSTNNDSSTGSDSSTGNDTSTTDSGGGPTGALFEQAEPWTKDVSGLSKASSSDAIITALAGMGGWGNGNDFQIDFSIPLFYGNSATPRMTVVGPSGGGYCYNGPDCDSVPLQMPIPTGANMEGSTNLVCDVTYNTPGQGDCHILVVERDQKKLYELYNSTSSGNDIAALGAFVWDLTKAYPDNERGDQCTSADAGGFPIAALLPTADEVASGTVKHALRFILPNARMKKDVYVHPASHAGTPSSGNANAPPYGVRFRLKSTFDETPFNTGEKVILQAMKQYGMLLSDGGQIALTFADDRTTTAKWAGQGITATSFSAIKVTDFEVVDLGSDIALTDNCVRN